MELNIKDHNVKRLTLDLDESYSLTISKTTGKNTNCRRKKWVSKMFALFLAVVSNFALFLTSILVIK